MAIRREVHESLICDLGAEEEHHASGTISVGLSGTWYELDVCDSHGVEVDRMLEPLVKRARKRGRQKRVVTRSRNPMQPPNKAVRAWAEAQGIPLPTRGRIPTIVIEKYLADQT